jgi:hypothetical protein
MATEPHTRSSIREERARRADGGQPLNTETRTVHREGNSLVIGLTAYAVKTHDIDPGQTPEVVAYPDGIWIDLRGASDE